VRAIPDAMAKSVANFLYEDIICRHGYPQELVSDNGSAFISQVVEAILERHQIKHWLISPYHPQSNGLVERFNRTLCSSLAKYVQVMEEDWDKFLPSVLFAYRTMRHNTTKFEPFSLVYGRSAITPLDLLLEEDNLEKLPEEEIEKQVLRRTFELIDTLEPTIQAAKKNIESSQQK
jgi:transposase InsO family protein